MPPRAAPTTPKSKKLTPSLSHVLVQFSIAGEITQLPLAKGKEPLFLSAEHAVVR
jgi:hypothetical protein